MKKSSVIMILSAFLFAAGLALVIAGGMSGASQIVSFTADGIEFAGEGLDKLLDKIEEHSPSAGEVIKDSGIFRETFGKIEIDVIGADVQVVPCSESYYRVDTICPDNERIEVSSSNGTLKIKQKQSGFLGLFHWSSGKDNRVKLYVPALAGSESFHVETVSGDVDWSLSSSMIDNVSVSTVSGRINGIVKASSVSLSSVSGDIGGTVYGGCISLDSTSGDLNVRTLEFVSLKTHNVSGKTDLTCGMSEAGIASGRMDLFSVSGDIHLLLKNDFYLYNTSFSSVSGKWNISGADQASVSGGTIPLKVETTSGDLYMKFS